MTRIIHLHIPEMPWSDLMSQHADTHLSHFVHLIETGASGAMPAIGPAPLVDGVLATAKRPQDNGLITRHAIKPDGFGTMPASGLVFKSPPWWELLDTNKISGAVINFRATALSHLQNGSIVSDQFCEIYSRTASDWGIPPNSIAPPELINDLAPLRLHPQELTRGHLAPFLARFADNHSINDKEIRIIARTLAENTTAHAIATWFLEHQSPDYLLVRYHALEQLRPHFSNHQAIPEQSLLWAFMEFLDAFLARLIDLSDNDCIFFITGGSIEIPFWIATGPGIKTDQLFPAGTSLYDVPASILSLFDFKLPEDIRGQVPIQVFDKTIFTQSQTLPPVPESNPVITDAKQWIQKLSEQGYTATKPSTDQIALIEQAQFREQFMLGENARYENRLFDAFKFYKQALKLQPNDKATTFHLCNLLTSMNDLKEIEGFLGNIAIDYRQTFCARLLRIKAELLRENLVLARKLFQQLSIQASTEAQKFQLGNLRKYFPDYDN